MSDQERSDLVMFLSGEGRDSRGRLLEDILDFSDQRLEALHDFIQWLFPLDTPSAAVPGSPVLTAADIEAIRADTSCQTNLKRSAERMARFYTENDHWLVPADHNHLRITRIIRSLRLLVGREEAEKFADGIMKRVRQAGAPVSSTSQRYWREALD